VNAQVAAAAAEEAAEALRSTGMPAFAVLEDLGRGDYDSYVAIERDAAHELAHQRKVEGL
jgi:hypothetical protein